MCNYRAMVMPVLVAVTVFATFLVSTGAGAQNLLPFPGAAQLSAPSSPQVYDLPAQGPPTTNVLVQGSGFDPLTAIDIYFDGTKLASTTTDKNGGFGNGVVTTTGASFAHILVPADAQPGTHTVLAQERVGQKSAQKSFLVQTDWTQSRFDAQHSGFNSYENTLNPSNVQNLAQDWQYPLPNQVWGNPVVANGVTYFTTDYPDFTLYAVDAATGALLWKSATGQAGGTSPTVANGIVYIGAQKPNVGLSAFNAATGALLWQYASPSVPTEPIVADGVAYIGAGTSMVALNASTGKLLWTYETGAAVQAPALANGKLYFQSIYFIYPDTYVNTLYAVDATSHQLIWQQQWTRDGALIPPAVVGGNVVYFNGDAFNANDGSLLWGSLNGDDTIAAMANGVVYDTIQWSVGVTATDAVTGKTLWTFIAGGQLEGTPAVANGVVYFESDDGYAYAVNAATGVQLWKYNVSGRGPASPVVANGIVYFPAHAGSGGLWAFHLPNQSQSEQPSSPLGSDTGLLTPGTPRSGATSNLK